MATENLDEMINRKARQTDTEHSWGAEWLEDTSNYTWQPETLCYKDITTGAEVWRMTSTAGLRNMYHNGLQATPWSADGRRLSFVTTRDTNAYAKDPADAQIWFTVRSTGQYCRAIVNAASREYWSTQCPYVHWSPTETDTYYDFGVTKHGLTSNENSLYKVTVNDTSDTRVEYIVFPTDQYPSLRLSKTMSTDGLKILALTRDEAWLYPATIYPETEKGILVADGYTCNRPHGATTTERTYWGDTPDSWNSMHGQSLLGRGDWIWLMPSGSSSFWRFALTGSHTDGGSDYTHDTTYPYNWGGEAEPVNTVTNAGTGPDPWCKAAGTESGYQCASYFSHPVQDPWGRYVFYNPAIDGTPRVYDIENHVIVTDYSSDNYQHGSCHIWSNKVAHSYGPEADDYTNDRIITRDIALDGATTLCYTHTLLNNNGAYNGATYEYMSLVRPELSPDGTKVAYHSTFLNDKTGSYDDCPDIYWAVCYYPYPPEITQCNASGGTVTVQFDWRLGTAEPRSYTDRGWPDESTDDPPAPRETKLFRLWRSSDGTNWIPQGTVNANPFDKWDYVNGGLQSGANSYWEITDSPGDGTWYYAVTAVEHSSLESRTLSNIFSITVSGGSGTGSENTVYPNDPGADDNFYSTAPTPPQSISYGHQNQTNLTSGQYTITWDAPADTDLIRYYNIYANDGSAPTVTQKRRIASIPHSSGSFEWVDCFGATDGTTEYTVTSVDTLGNESSTALAAPSQIQCEGEANPTNVTDSKPEFRAYVKPLSETNAPDIVKIQIQVSASSKFSATDLEWDSGMLTLDTPLSSEGWTEEIEYEQT